MDALTFDSERFPARREDTDVAARPQHGIRHFGRSRHQVLAVVEHDGQVARGKGVDQRVEDRSSRLLAHPEHGRDLAGQVLGRGHVAELDEPDPAPRAVHELSGHFEGEARLSDTSRPRQGDEPRSRVE